MLNQLYYLVEVGHNTTLLAASQNLHLTPQALSMAISALEKEIDITLLNRGRKGISLTEDGKKAVQAAEIFIQSLMSIKHQSVDVSQLRGKLEINVTEGALHNITPQLIPYFYKIAPKLQCQICQQSYDEGLQKLQKGQIPFLMTYQTKINGLLLYPSEKNLTFHPISPGRLFCLAAPNFTLSQYKKISIKTMLKYPIVIFDPLNLKTVSNYTLLKQFGAPKNIRFETDHAVYNELVFSGLGIAFGILFPFKQMPQDSAEHIVAVPLKENIHLEFGYYTKNEEPLPDIASCFLDILTRNYQAILK